MKRIIILIVIMGLSSTMAWSQKQGDYSIPLIGSKAPSFTAESTRGTITFPDDYGNSWKILFSHPRDFTPVCSTELMELAELQPEFDQLKVKVAVLSTDKLSEHEAWKKSMEDLTYKGSKIPKIEFPLIADENKAASTLYGMVHYPVSTTEDVRGVFVVDPNNVVQAVFFYPMKVGRNMDEILRTVEALQTAKNNIATPADWKPGDDVILSFLNEQEERQEMQKNPDIYQVSWYLTMEKSPKH